MDRDSRTIRSSGRRFLQSQDGGLVESRSPNNFVPSQYARCRGCVDPECAFRRIFGPITKSLFAYLFQPAGEDRKDIVVNSTVGAMVHVVPKHWTKQFLPELPVECVVELQRDPFFHYEVTARLNSLTSWTHTLALFRCLSPEVRICVTQMHWDELGPDKEPLPDAASQCWRICWERGDVHRCLDPRSALWERGDVHRCFDPRSAPWERGDVDRSLNPLRDTVTTNPAVSESNQKNAWCVRGEALGPCTYRLTACGKLCDCRSCRLLGPPWSETRSCFKALHFGGSDHLPDVLLRTVGTFAFDSITMVFGRHMGVASYFSRLHAPTEATKNH